jgi:hypothetical protein
VNDNPQWLKQAKDLLDQSAQNLDAATLSRLNRARQQALGSRRFSARRWALPAGFASACVLLLAVAAWHGHSHAPRSSGNAVPTANDAPAGDAEALTDDDDLYDDLDFYTWLDAQDQDPEG